MRRNSGNGGCVTNIIFLVVIYSLAVSANLIEKLEINFWLASGIVIALILCGVGLVRGIRSITIAVKRWKRCSHGVRRGKDGGCRQCIADEEHRQAEQQAYQARQDLKASIKRDASVLLAAELNTLHKKWLSRSELYLQMNSQQFEDAVAILFRELGFQVKQTPYSNDRGKDAIAWKDGKKYLIECKRYDSQNTIGRRELQIFVAAMKEEGAQGGFYVNTGRFANTAPEYAMQNQIDLYDGARFPALVNSAFPTREDVSNAKVMCLECGVVLYLPIANTPTSGACINGHTVTNEITSVRIVGSPFAPIPVMSGSPSVQDRVCDKCSSKMRLIDGRKGKFWGCCRFPKCRFTRPYGSASENSRTSR